MPVFERAPARPPPANAARSDPVRAARPRILLARLATAFALSLELACTGCDSHEEAATPMAPPQVTVMPAVRREITDWDEFTGRFVSTERVELRARVSGYLDAVSFADGQVVQRGDLLFRIDPRPLEAAVAEVQARLAGVRSQVTLAEREFDRTKNLLQYRAASEANLEQRSQALENCPGAGHTGRGRTATGPARPRIHHRSAPRIDRPHRPPPGQPGQPGLGRGGQHGDAARHHRHHGPDRRRLRYRPGRGAAIHPAGRSAATGRRRATWESGAARPCGRDRVPACRATSSSSTTRPMRASARSACGRASTIRATSSTPGIFARVRLVASLPYQAPAGARCGGGHGPVAPRALRPRRRATRWKPARSRSARCMAALRVIRDGLRGDEEIVVNGMMRVRAGQAVIPRRPTATGTATVSEARP